MILWQQHRTYAKSPNRYSSTNCGYEQAPVLTWPSPFTLVVKASGRLDAAINLTLALIRTRLAYQATDRSPLYDWIDGLSAQRKSPPLILSLTRRGGEEMELRGRQVSSG